ncbi:MAG: lipopolysaccharide biosynthesis protein [Planctomycetota bacterium]
MSGSNDERVGAGAIAEGMSCIESDREEDAFRPLPVQSDDLDPGEHQSPLGEPSSARAATDSLASGLAFMLVLTVVQRLVGFVRSILFCSLLQDDELGRWSLAFSFLMLAAPLAVFGLPGSFGRYVEHYRGRSQLGTFLRRTVIVSSVFVALTVGVLLWWAPFWAWLILGDAELAFTMRVLALVLVAVIASNFVTELLTAMRKVRAVSVMQFASSMLFATIGIGLISFTPLREKAVIIAFGVASLVAVLVAMKPLQSVRREAGAARGTLSQRSLWQKLVPFAVWMWLTNLLSNLFEAADRFMIVHFSPDTVKNAESLVGQYHASRVVPCVLIAITALVAGVILPYLSHDWEAGRWRTVWRGQALTLKLGSLILTVCGLLILLAAPLLFGWVLRGKYDQGLDVLPWTVTYCIWFSLIALGQNYLLCVEKARLGAMAFFAGLALNLALNLVLLPRFGLIGAIMATTAGNVTAMLLVLYFSARHGLTMDRHLMFCCGLPAVLVLGPWPALAAVLTLALFAVRRQWLFDDEDREIMVGVVSHFSNRWGQWFRRKWFTRKHPTAA